MKKIVFIFFSFLVWNFLNPQAFAAKLSPTIYYIKVIDLNKPCRSGKNIIHGDRGQELYRVCSDQYKACMIEGTCAIQKDAVSDIENQNTDFNKPIDIINYKGTKNGVAIFSQVDRQVCPWGFGVSQICLDPYYSIAADLNYHKAGEVIFVDKLKGVRLPNGEVHSGLLVVRDRGGAIKGRDRFDFFTGVVEYLDPENPFTKIGLAGSTNKFEYRLATAHETEAFKSERQFPKVPREH